MQLTEYEQAMLDGRHGETVQMAMEIIVKMGKLYHAKRLLPIKNAHIDSAAYTTIWDSGTKFLEYLAEHGARMAAPTTINPLSRDIKNWKALGASEEFARKSEKIENAYLKMGVIPTWTCAPYQCTNVPQFGEVVSWSESNAVNYVNSVIGARAERLPDLFDTCCAIAGRVPEYGMYLDENRKGDVLFKLEGFDENWFKDSVDYAVLGYYVGELVINKVPVLQGLPDRTMPDDLKAMSAAMASGGAVCMFHVIGITPEAPTVEAAFGGKTGYEIRKVTPEDLIQMKVRLDTAESDQVDAVLMGCPHLSFTELQEVAEYIKGKKVKEGVQFYLTTSETQYHLAKRCGVADILAEAGATVACDTCIMEMEEDGRWEGKTLVTNSGKAAQYAPAINRVHIKMASAKGCVDAAVTGCLPKEERVCG